MQMRSINKQKTKDFRFKSRKYWKYFVKLLFEAFLLHQFCVVVIRAGTNQIYKIECGQFLNNEELWNLSFIFHVLPCFCVVDERRHGYS